MVVVRHGSLVLFSQQRQWTLCWATYIVFWWPMYHNNVPVAQCWCSRGARGDLRWFVVVELYWFRLRQVVCQGGCHYYRSGDGNIQLQLSIWLCLRELRCCLCHGHGGGLARNGGCHCSQLQKFSASYAAWLVRGEKEICLGCSQTRGRNIIFGCELGLGQEPHFSSAVYAPVLKLIRNAQNNWGRYPFLHWSIFHMLFLKKKFDIPNTKMGRKNILCAIAIRWRNFKTILT